MTRLEVLLVLGHVQHDLLQSLRQMLLVVPGVDEFFVVCGFDEDLQLRLQNAADDLNVRVRLLGQLHNGKKKFFLILKKKKDVHKKEQTSYLIVTDGPLCQLDVDLVETLVKLDLALFVSHEARHHDDIVFPLARLFVLEPLLAHDRRRVQLELALVLVCYKFLVWPRMESK